MTATPSHGPKRQSSLRSRAVKDGGFAGLCKFVPQYLQLLCSKKTTLAQLCMFLFQNSNKVDETCRPHSDPDLSLACVGGSVCVV